VTIAVAIGARLRSPRDCTKKAGNHQAKTSTFLGTGLSVRRWKGTGVLPVLGSVSSVLEAARFQVGRTRNQMLNSVACEECGKKERSPRIYSGKQMYFGRLKHRPEEMRRGETATSREQFRIKELIKHGSIDAGPTEIQAFRPGWKEWASKKRVATIYSGK